MFEGVTHTAPTDASLLPSPAPLHDPRLSVNGQWAPVPWVRTRLGLGAASCSHRRQGVSAGAGRARLEVGVIGILSVNKLRK